MNDKITRVYADLANSKDMSSECKFMLFKGNFACVDMKQDIPIETQNSFSASFTCNIDNTTCLKLFGSKRERYETNSIYRYYHTKKSRKKKQMLRYCKKYNWKIVGVAK